MIEVDISQIPGFVPQDRIAAFEPQVKDALEKLEKGTGQGSDFIGWMDLASRTDRALLDEIMSVAGILRENCDTVVVAGIGGSYLGSRAVIEAFQSSFPQLSDGNGSPAVLFAGQNISEDYLFELLELLKNRRFGVINISKSGTTTETALAFRLLKKQCEEQRGLEMARKVIVSVTDAVRGAAREMAAKEGYRTFIIPDNVGGRYSVLTPVGLLPIAVAGYDIAGLIEGAVVMESRTSSKVPFLQNPSAVYASVRNVLYQSGRKIEILANFCPRLHSFGEWWKQLFGESEGKDGKGIYPSSVDLSTDLHSMGQWIQQGERTIFETVISVEKVKHSLCVPFDAENLDGLNYMAGKHVDEVNRMAELGTRLAHVDGGVPNIRISVPQLDEYCMGQLIYFFEKACGISGYLLGVNPFNQPGVEEYKRNMFALLGKPGYEKESEAIRARIGK